MRASDTRAAEGFDRRAFTVDEALRMQRAGIIGDDENFDLIEGEIVPMQARTHAHELLKSAFGIEIARSLPTSPWVGFETTICLMPDIFVEPDLVVCPRGLKLESVKGRDLGLAIEIAASSLAYDRDDKSRLYARHGVQDYWVVDAARRPTFVHAGPSEESWAHRREKEAEDVLKCPDLPDFAIRLADY